MISKNVKNLIIGLVITLTLLCGSIITKAAGFGIKPFVLNPSNIVYVQKNIAKESVQSKGKILIYSTHTNEKNEGGNISVMAEDLSEKLRSQGYEVEHNTDDFVGTNDYNKAYYNSRKMLATKDLNTYSLIIDYHIDSASNEISTIIDDKSIAKVMFPTVDQNPNLQKQKKIIEGITQNLNKVSDGIVRKETTAYHFGISYYNSDRSDNFILMESGGNKNDLYSCKRSNTLVAKAISEYLNDN